MYFLYVYRLKLCMHFSYPMFATCPRQSNSRWYDLLNAAWWRSQFMRLIITWLPASFSYVLCLFLSTALNYKTLRVKDRRTVESELQMKRLSLLANMPFLHQTEQLDNSFLPSVSLIAWCWGTQWTRLLKHCHATSVLSCPIQTAVDKGSHSAPWTSFLTLSKRRGP